MLFWIVVTSTSNPDIWFKFLGYGACPVQDGYILMEDNILCIKYHPEMLMYTAANEICKSEGGYLLKVESPTKQSSVEQFLGR